jgi:hypothetical protein
MHISFPRSSMPVTRYAAPLFRVNERLLLKRQCAFRCFPYRGWRPAQCFLTDQRIIFFLRPRILAQVDLSTVIGLGVERRYCILKIRETLKISFQRNDRPSAIWFVANELRRWKEEIYQLALLKIDDQTICDLSLRLDPDSRQLLWYLWEKRHASIREMTALMGIEDPIDTLRLIRGTINPAAENLLGCPLVVFERFKVCPLTQTPVKFHWWLMGRHTRCSHNPERFLDIFDEGNRVIVIMAVRGVAIPDIQLDIEDSDLTVRSHRIGATMRVKVPLPVPVQSETCGLRLKNGLLEIVLPKA